MARRLVLGALLAALHAEFLFPQEPSAWISAMDILHIGGGEIGAAVAGAELDGAAGFSVSALRSASSIDGLHFSAEAVSAAVHFPIKDARISARISGAALHDIDICNTASFESAGIVAAGVSAKVPILGGTASISPFFTAGRMSAAGGEAYGFKAVPELPSFLLFGASAALPPLTVLLQAGVSGISVRSEAESDIDSSSFQKQLLLLFGDRITFGKTSTSWWGGAFYTDGKAEARTKRGDAAIFAEDRFLILGTGAQLASGGARFFWSAGLHFLYLPLGFAAVEFSCDIKLLFSEMHQKFNYAFDSAGGMGLLLPRISGGIRFLKNGRLFINKAFYVPLRFSAPSAGKTGALPSGADAAQLLAAALLSGLSVSIRI